MQLIDALHSVDFDKTKVFIDTDLNVYTDNILRRVVVWLTSWVSNRYDAVDVSSKIAEFFSSHVDTIKLDTTCVNNLVSISQKFAKSANDTNREKLQANFQRVGEAVNAIFAKEMAANATTEDKIISFVLEKLSTPLGKAALGVAGVGIALYATKSPWVWNFIGMNVATSIAMQLFSGLGDFGNTEKKGFSATNLIKAAVFPVAAHLALTGIDFGATEFIETPKNIWTEASPIAFFRDLIKGTGWVVAAKAGLFMGMVDPFSCTQRALLKTFASMPNLVAPTSMPKLFAFKEESLYVPPLYMPHTFSSYTSAMANGLGLSKSAQKTTKIATEVLTVLYLLASQENWNWDSYELVKWTLFPYVFSVAMPALAKGVQALLVDEEESLPPKKKFRLLLQLKPH